jgi:hypothetical protein
MSCRSAVLIRSAALFALSTLVGCGSSNQGPSDAGPVVDSGAYVDSGPVDMVLDAGPIDAGRYDAPGFGPFTGAYTINSGGLLLAAQIDGYVAILLNGEPNAYLGTADAGHVDGGRPLPDAGLLPDGGHPGTILDAAQYFNTELEYAALETCGAITLDGTFNATKESYVAVNNLCTAGSPSTVDFPGTQLLGSEFFAQDLSQSGVFDVTETPTASDGCVYPRTPPFHAKIGFSVGLDGGPALAMVVGDGIFNEIDLPAAPSAGKLTAHSIDVNGNANGTLTLGPPSGTTWTGTRTFAYTPIYGDGGVGSLCAASLALSGTERTE